MLTLADEIVGVSVGISDAEADGSGAAADGVGDEWPVRPGVLITGGGAAADAGVLITAGGAAGADGGGPCAVPAPVEAVALSARCCGPAAGTEADDVGGLAVVGVFWLGGALSVSCVPAAEGAVARACLPMVIPNARLKDAVAKKTAPTMVAWRAVDRGGFARGPGEGSGGESSSVAFCGRPGSFMTWPARLVVSWCSLSGGTAWGMWLSLVLERAVGGGSGAIENRAARRWPVTSVFAGRGPGP